MLQLDRAEAEEMIRKSDSEAQVAAFSLCVFSGVVCSDIQCITALYCMRLFVPFTF